MARQITCVSHGCLVWGDPNHPDESRDLPYEDCVALMHAHALIHYNRPITPHTLWRNLPENDT